MKIWKFNFKNWKNNILLKVAIKTYEWGELSQISCKNIQYFFFILLKRFLFFNSLGINEPNEPYKKTKRIPQSFPAL